MLYARGWDDDVDGPGGRVEYTEDIIDNGFAALVIGFAMTRSCDRKGLQRRTPRPLFTTAPRRTPPLP